MNKRRYRHLIYGCLLLIAFLCLYSYCFYPQQQMPVGQPVFISTPDPRTYNNDCLHPCVRRISRDSFVMVQSPYYSWDCKVENPIVYFSSSLTDWGNGTLLADTPMTGYNSDPTVFVDDSLVYVFWRECDTPTCKDNGAHEVVVGNSIKGNKPTITERNEYLTNSYDGVDVTQCPILLKYDGKYMFYAVWYQYEPGRKNKGIAIWEGSSLDNPFFKLLDTIPFNNPLVCDKLFQKKIGHRIYFIPFPKRYDLWHFDLFEYGGKLFMVSCAEKDDNIMLSVSIDWKHFKTSRKPLVNNHYSENHTGYRQYYYKPTALVKNDSLYLYYTANAQDDSKRNQLFLSIKSMEDLQY